ncbi:MAG: hypothetical protein HKP58_14690 [Desulfatitalea sp.]|nr:hypothetical protein [Desulfatitalea sp.]NNK01654.1 hypothetical protein [Desulfatitalea sp.]
MKVIFSTLFLALLLAVSAPPLLYANSDVQLITKEQLKPLVDNPDLVIVDVRRGKDWKSSEFKIKGAVYADPGDYENWAGVYPKDKKLALYCACPNEATSAGLARRLIADGYKDVSALKGGWREWFRAKYPVEDK